MDEAARAIRRPSRSRATRGSGRRPAGATSSAQRPDQPVRRADPRRRRGARASRTSTGPAGPGRRPARGRRCASQAFMLIVPLKPSVKSAWPAGSCSRPYTPRASATAAPASTAHRNAIVSRFDGVRARPLPSGDSTLLAGPTQAPPGGMVCRRAAGRPRASGVAPSPSETIPRQIPERPEGGGPARRPGGRSGDGGRAAGGSRPRRRRRSRWWPRPRRRGARRSGARWPDRGPSPARCGRSSPGRSARTRGAGRPGRCRRRGPGPPGSARRPPRRWPSRAGCTSPALSTRLAMARSIIRGRTVTWESPAWVTLDRPPGAALGAGSHGLGQLGQVDQLRLLVGRRPVGGQLDQLVDEVGQLAAPRSRCRAAPPADARPAGRGPAAGARRWCAAS